MMTRSEKRLRRLRHFRKAVISAHQDGLIIFRWARPKGMIGLFIAVIALTAGCAAEKPKMVLQQPIKKNIAVWDIENVTPGGNAYPNLGDLLSVKVIEVIKESATYEVVERERLSLALEELHLGTSSLVDESARLRLGSLVGAQMMVFGAYQVIGDKMRIDLRLVDVETGRILKAVERTVAAQDISGWTAAAAAAAGELI